MGIDRPTIRDEDELREPRAVYLYSGPMEEACARLLAFVYNNGEFEIFGTGMIAKEVPAELLAPTILALCEKRGWVSALGSTVAITKSGIAAIEVEALRLRAQDSENGEVGDAITVVFSEMKGRAARNPGIEVVRRVNGKVVDRAKVCGRELVALFRVVEELSRSRVADDIPTWDDVIAKHAANKQWKGKILSEKTLRDYSRRIRRALNEANLGGLWNHNSTGVRWR